MRRQQLITANFLPLPELQIRRAFTQCVCVSGALNSLPLGTIRDAEGRSNMVLHNFKDSSRVNNKLRAGGRWRRTLPVKTDPSGNIWVSGEIVGVLGSEVLR